MMYKVEKSSQFVPPSSPGADAPAQIPAAPSHEVPSALHGHSVVQAQPEHRRATGTAQSLHERLEAVRIKIGSLSQQREHKPFALEFLAAAHAVLALRNRGDSAQAESALQQLEEQMARHQDPSQTLIDLGRTGGQLTGLRPEEIEEHALAWVGARRLVAAADRSAPRAIAELRRATRKVDLRLMQDKFGLHRMIDMRDVDALARAAGKLKQHPVGKHAQMRDDLAELQASLDACAPDPTLRREQLEANIKRAETAAWGVLYRLDHLGAGTAQLRREIIEDLSEHFKIDRWTDFHAVDGAGRVLKDRFMNTPRDNTIASFLQKLDALRALKLAH
jgi:hypothetical protein